MAFIDRKTTQRLETIARGLVGNMGSKEDIEDLVSIGKERILEMDFKFNPKEYLDSARSAMISAWKKERTYALRERVYKATRLKELLSGDEH